MLAGPPPCSWLVPPSSAGCQKVAGEWKEEKEAGKGQTVGDTSKGKEEIVEKKKMRGPLLMSLPVSLFVFI